VSVGSSQGEVLAVPLSAVSLAADGSSRVQRDDGHGRTTSVRVQPGLSAAGYVEVTPLGGSLAAGDLVVVGVTGPTGAADTTSTTTAATAATTTTTGPPGG
jgi:hypothetical protein